MRGFFWMCCIVATVIVGFVFAMARIVVVLTFESFLWVMGALFLFLAVAFIALKVEWDRK